MPSIIVISGQLSLELQKILESLTLSQRRRYNNSNKKVELLEMIRDEWKKPVHLLKYLFIFVKIPIYFTLTLTIYFTLILTSFFIGFYFLPNHIRSRLGNSIYWNLHNNNRDNYSGKCKIFYEWWINKNFFLNYNSVYYRAKFVIMGLKIEINGIIYNKVYAFIISTPIMFFLWSCWAFSFNHPW